MGGVDFTGIYMLCSFKLKVGDNGPDPFRSMTQRSQLLLLDG